MGINSYMYAICHDVLEDFVQLHINMVSILIWQNLHKSVGYQQILLNFLFLPLQYSVRIEECYPTSVKLPFQQTPEILYGIKVRWWEWPCHQFFALESNFCQVFNSGTSSMRWCVVLHEDYLLPECWAFAAVPRNKIIMKKVSVR